MKLKLKLLAISIAVLFELSANTSILSAQTFSLYRLHTTESKQLDAIAHDHEIVGHDGKNNYDVYVDPAAAKAFQKLAPAAKLISADVDAAWRQAWANENNFASGYHNFQAVQDFMANAVATYPSLASTQVYGASKQGNLLTYLKIGAPGDSRVTKPKIFLDAATHGDELISTEVLLNLVDELLKGYGSDPRLTAMLDRTDVYVSFVVNPDGFLKQSRYDNGVDPNRSYPWPNDPEHVPTASIQALIDLFANEKFDGSISFHAYGKLLMYPWGYTTSPLTNSLDRTNFETLTESLAAKNNYTYGPIATTIYVAKGSSVDYYYWKFHTQALAVELSTNKVPSASKIPAVTSEAREMVWGFIEHFYL